MNTPLETIAITLAGVGITLGAIHLLVWSVQALRKAPPEQQAELIPWNYLGSGLILACVGFYVSRGTTTGAWGAVQDTTSLVMVLGVTAGGYGAAHGWFNVLRGRQTTVWSFLVPLALSAATGVMLGLANPTEW